MQKTLIALFSAGLMTMATTTLAAGDPIAGKYKFKATCVGCHGSNAEGMVGPKLAGQSAEEIVRKLTEYRAGKKRGPMTSMMAPMAQGLTETEVHNLAAYVSGL